MLAHGKWDSARKSTGAATPAAAEVINIALATINVYTFKDWRVVGAVVARLEWIYARGKLNADGI